MMPCNIGVVVFVTATLVCGTLTVETSAKDEVVILYY